MLRDEKRSDDEIGMREEFSSTKTSKLRIVIYFMCVRIGFTHNASFEVLFEATN